MNAVEIINLVAGIASLILSVLAIWLSLYFYDKSKNTESKVDKALEGIRVQTQSLETLTGKWMDRFTKYVTNPKAADETSLLLMQIVREYSTQNIGGQLKEVDSGATKEALANELVSSYIVVFFYTAVANVALQAHLPSEITDLTTDDGAKGLVDSSYADFQRLDSILSSVDRSRLESNNLYSLYQIGVQNWKPYVKDTTTVYRDRQTMSLQSELPA